MALQNRENGVALSFTTVEKEDEDNIQVSFFSHNTLNPDSHNTLFFPQFLGEVLSVFL